MTNRALALVVAGVLVAGAGGWTVGMSVQSPADAAAARRPPAPSLVSVPVERRVLTATVVTRGTVEFGSPQPLTLAGAVGSADAGAAGGGGADGAAAGERVTRPPVAGQTLREGMAVMEVNGRPVFALAGRVPMFRTIGPGRSGRDVEQLQRALKRLGFSPGRTGGTFSAATARAVRRWYRARGYEAQQPSVAETQQLHALEQAVRAATESELAARTAAAAPASGSARAMLDLQLRHARAGLRDAERDLAGYRRGLGTTVPAGEVIFLPSLPLRMTTVAARTGQQVEGRIGTVTSAAVVVRANVTREDAELLRAGMAVTMQTTAGSTVRGTVTALREKARPPAAADAAGGKDEADGADGTAAAAPAAGADGAPEAATDAVPVLVTPRDGRVLAGQAGATVKVSIVVGATSSKVLVVPVSAVTTGADGQSRLQADRGGERTEDVPVRLGLAALGYVEVTPTGGRLAAGDRVVVGIR